MPNARELYERAKSRADLSTSVVHLCKGENAGTTLRQILRDLRVNASKRPEVVRGDPLGAACFYDVPSPYDGLLRTNPSGRRGYGIIVTKESLWEVGGRPAIYTDDWAFPAGWPESERFRLIYTRLSRNPPVDWMHEREWRTRGALDLSTLQGWYPLVPSREEVLALAAEFPTIESIACVERQGFFALHGGEVEGEWDEDHPMLTAEEEALLLERVEEERRNWEREAQEARSKRRPLVTSTGEFLGTSTGYVGKPGDVITSAGDPAMFFRVLSFGDSITVEHITEEVARREAKPPEYAPYLHYMIDGKLVSGADLDRLQTGSSD